MATHAERRLAARAAREAKERRTATPAGRRLILLGATFVLVAAVLAVVIALSAGGHPTSTSAANKPAAVSSVESLLSGIPQSGMTLGRASAPVTITEYSDLVCPACDEFANTSERQLIAQEVASGHAKLVSRGLETASGIANGSEYTASQAAIRSAGLQGHAWDYILIAYAEQPQEIGGKSAEDVAYITPAYLQNIASAVPGLNLIKWQATLSSSPLANAVTADGRAASKAGINSTPSLVISGRAQTLRLTGAVPLSDIQSAMRQAAGH